MNQQVHAFCILAYTHMTKPSFISNQLHLAPWIITLCTSVALLVNIACSSDNEPTATRTTANRDNAPINYDGEESFLNRCSVCHGETANGTQSGPPLVNRLYEIGHHPNFSFHNAVNKGVISHHWNFGDMPPIPNVEPAEIDAIICHVRDLQRAEGLPAGEPC